MNINLNLNSFDLTLKANESRPLSVTGAYFFCTAASVPFKVSFNGGNQSSFGVGFAVNFDPDSFTALLIVNTTNAVQTVSFYTSAYPVVFNNLSGTFLIKDSPSYPKGTGDVALAAAATNTYTGLDGANVRKQFVITNRAAAGTNPLFVQDSTPNTLLTVWGQESKTLQTAGTLKVNNPNGGAVTYQVGETFYS